MGGDLQIELVRTYVTFFPTEISIHVCSLGEEMGRKERIGGEDVVRGRTRRMNLPYLDLTAVN